MNKRILDVLYSCVAVLFSVFCFLYLIPVHVRSNTSFAVGPRTFPNIAAAVIGFVGLMLIVTRFPELMRKSVFLKKENYSFDWKAFCRQAGFIASMIVYIKLIPILGFIPASVVFVFFMLYYFGSNRFLINILIAVIFTLITYMLFGFLFRISLPSGLLPF
jgi:hypothetical protein